jgi:restriction system protein
MTVPDYQSLMLPVLRKANAGEVRIRDVVDELSNDLNLTAQDRGELLPSGRQTTFANRVHWAKTYLKQAGLVEIPRRAHFRISERGRQVLAENPERIDNKLLSQFDEFRQFQALRYREENASETPESLVETESKESHTPDELMRSVHNQINTALGEELLDRIITAPPEFFERLIVTLLLSMGYGGSSKEAGRAIGRSGDDGVDGVIDQDPLGLDRVYIQAKRYKSDSKIGPGAIRDFFGSLDMHKATKGLFVTTSEFSSPAAETASKLGKRIVLIDGNELTRLMIRHNVGCKIEDTLFIKRIDEDFFEY